MPYKDPAARLRYFRLRRAKKKVIHIAAVPVPTTLKLRPAPPPPPTMGKITWSDELNCLVIDGKQPEVPSKLKDWKPSTEEYWWQVLRA